MVITLVLGDVTYRVARRNENARCDRRRVLAFPPTTTYGRRQALRAPVCGAKRTAVFAVALVAGCRLTKRLDLG